MARHLTAIPARTAVAVLAVLLLTVPAGCGTVNPLEAPPATVPAVPTAATPGVAPAHPTAGPGLPVGTVTPWPATAPAAATAAAGVVAPGADPTGTGWAPGSLDAVPGPPRVLAVPADFWSAEAVAAAYLAAWCWVPADQPANTNLRNAAGWVTAAGWADDTSRAVDATTWAQTRAAGVSTVCGPVTAARSPGGPGTDQTAWVLVSAQQARIRDGVIIGQSPVSMLRRVLLAPDDRWLVDVRVSAG